jgi:hypothetical protein
MAGEAIHGSVYLIISGLHNDQILSTWVGTANLNGNHKKEVLLALIAPGCDEDGDGLMPCATKPECCGGFSGNQVIDKLSDCADDDPNANPLMVVPECMSCQNAPPEWKDPGLWVDINCDGIIDHCDDVDEDDHEDCNPLIDCNNAIPEGKAINASAKEECDGVDNNCDGQTDEGVTNNCETYDPPLCTTFETCAPCADAPLEACGDSDEGNGLDDNCNGLTDEGCGTKSDWDGDGFVGEKDCNNYDAKIFLGSKYSGCCPPVLLELSLSAQEVLLLCDFDCDGEATICSAADADFDGYDDDIECVDGKGDPTAHPGAPEKCGDGKDNDCKGGDLACEGQTDADKDGYPSSDDCDDTDPLIHPFAVELCNGKDDDCNGFVDDGNPEDGSGDPINGNTNGWVRCPHPQKGATGVCAIPENYGTFVCVVKASDGLPLTVRCVDYYNKDHPEEHCDGLDEDCEGGTDEDFPLTLLDLSEVMGSDQSCGVGLCAGGTTQCNAFGDGIVCSTEDSETVKDEVCNGEDDDCDGKTDAVDAADVLANDTTPCELTQGVCVDSTKPIALCSAGKWQECKPANYANQSGGLYESGSETLCDGLDNDCDGAIDEDFPLTLLDMSVVTGINQTCGTGACATSTTQCDGAGLAIECPSEKQATNEICDGVDNDCDGKTDAADGNELVTNDLEYCGNQKGACEGSTKPTDLCKNGKWTACGNSVYQVQNPDFQATKETSCDGLDNDCNGTTDEDFSVTLLNGSTVQGAGNSCGVGACDKGTTQCSGLGAIVCSTESGSSSKVTQETCDNKDNDCDGQTDDGLNSNSSDCTCNLTKGVCNPNTVIAVCSQGKYTCNYTTNNPLYEAPESSCDGKDNDCDGLTDQEDSSVQAPDICDKDGVCAQLNSATCEGSNGWQCQYTTLNSPGNLIYTPIEDTGFGNWCDDQDNDCDGSTDETYSTKGDECTPGEGVCKNTGKKVCKSDQSGVECNVTGKPDTVACDDGDPQTQNDRCTGGDNSTCQGESFSCDVDGFVCTTAEPNGDGTCTQQVNNGTCLINGVCYNQNDENGANECQWCKHSNPKSWSNKPGSTGCDDGINCTDNDHCASGACVGSSTYSCNDGKTCTSDSCGEATGECVFTLNSDSCLIAAACYDNGDVNPNDPCQVCLPLVPNSWSTYEDETPCNDGLKCTTASECQSGSCDPVTWVTCDDSNDCTADSCKESAPGDGCEFTNVNSGEDCEDGNACTEDDTCDGNGGCDSGNDVICDDGDACTFDDCDTADGCEATIIPGLPCDDGAACTYNDLCQVSGACQGTGYGCNDNDVCTDDKCLGDNTCDFSNNEVSCDDSNVCTTQDSCAFGSCAGGPPLVCDNDDACDGLETCDSGTGCVDGSPLVCGDENACNGVETCDSGTGCVDGTAPNCDDSIACTNDSCVPATGCDNAPDDGLCADANVCTTNVCNVSAGCETTNNTASCDDGEHCNGSDSCSGGSCVSSGDPCAANVGDADSDCAESCDEATDTCTASDPNGSACSDFDSCTVSADEQCSSGVCISGTPFVGCDDGLECTTDTCNGSGPTPDCDYTIDAGFCAIEGVCYADLDPNPASNPDVNEACQMCNSAPGSNTVWSSKPDESGCNDGLTCTDPDECTDGVCSGVDICPSGQACEPNNQCADAKTGGPGKNFYVSWLFGYFINLEINPPLILKRGESYTFHFLVGLNGHLFQIRKSVMGDLYNKGVTNNTTQSGTLTFDVPKDAPNQLVYRCSKHASHYGSISIIG